MPQLNKAQQLALKARFDRGPIYAKDANLTTAMQPWSEGDDVTVSQPLTYLQFRRRVQTMFGGSGAVMVHWCGMWLGIEVDGYTHS